LTIKLTPHTLAQEVIFSGSLIFATNPLKGWRRTCVATRQIFSCQRTRRLFLQPSAQGT